MVDARVHGNQADIEVSECNAEQRDPGKVLVLVVQRRNDGPRLVTNWVSREVTESTADGVAACVARGGVQPQEGCVREQDQCSNRHVTPLAVAVTEGKDCIDGQQNVEDQTDIEEIAVRVLQDERRASLAGVLAVWLCNSTCRWRHPEAAVVRLAVVVTGHTEAEWENQNK